jgi:23S rRNA pseudouridine1911/1915/1917 synthase
MSQDLCPCGSLKKYSECCEPIIKKAEKASSPEVLMRSRYTGKMVTFEAPLEKPFEDVLKYLRKEAPCDNPSFNQTFFKDFESDRRYIDVEEVVEEDPYLYEEEPVKERMTRAERLLKKKERIARRKEFEIEKRRKKEEREAIRRGEIPSEYIVPGYEPTIDPNLLG